MTRINQLTEGRCEEAHERAIGPDLSRHQLLLLLLLLRGRGGGEGGSSGKSEVGHGFIAMGTELNIMCTSGVIPAYNAHAYRKLLCTDYILLRYPQ